MRKQPVRTKSDTRDTDPAGPWPALWLMVSDATISARFGRLLLRDASLGVHNTGDLNKAYDDAWRALGWNAVSLPLTSAWPRPRLSLTETDFAPDYFYQDGYHFCSRRLRDALAQPTDVVQFLPIDLVAGGEAVRAQDYAMMHILARQPVVDLARSDCRVEEITQRVSGRTLRIVTWVDRLALLDGLEPLSGIFRLQEMKSWTMVTDALAARVLHAGCTGLEFCAPEIDRGGKHVERCRTKTGIAERRVGFLD